MPKRHKKTDVNPDAFLEAVLDAFGLEDAVLLRLEVKAKALHAFMDAHREVVDAAVLELQERDIDTSEALLGWLRPSNSAPKPKQGDDWETYRAFLTEDEQAVHVAALDDAKTRTTVLLERLKLEKAAQKETREASDKPKRAFGDQPEDDSWDT